MEIQVGSRIAVETEHVGAADREGEVLEVIEHEGLRSYRVRWDDGHESIFLPTAGSVRLLTTS
jgi:hypothetical protein